jgi:hypothetical protein
MREQSHSAPALHMSVQGSPVGVGVEVVNGGGSGVGIEGAVAVGRGGSVDKPPLRRLRSVG